MGLIELSTSSGDQKRKSQEPQVPAGGPWGMPSGEGVPFAKPITTFLLKIASRCNLDCDYCYVYRGPDQSWRRKPTVMDGRVVEQTIRRIAEHVKGHGLPQVSVVVHGGEPLLAGLDLISRIFSAAKSEIPCNVDLGMQSNLTLVTKEVVEVFASFGATIGASLDGPKPANDLHRLSHSRSSSFAEVEAGLRLLCSTEKGRRVFSGILAVIDLRNDPLEVYTYLSGFRPRTLDFLLPDATHDCYPSGKTSFNHTPYADWLIRLFDHWWVQGQAQTPIRFFENVVTLLLQGKSDTEYLGLAPVDLIVVESDGALEAVDTLKFAYEGAPELGLNVFDASFDEALRHPAVLSRMAGRDSRSEECRSCPLLRVCGGGYLPHRFSAERGFLNPTVYCHDLAKIILHIRKAVQTSLHRRGGTGHRDEAGHE